MYHFPMSSVIITHTHTTISVSILLSILLFVGEFRTRSHTVKLVSSLTARDQQEEDTLDRGGIPR